MKTVKCPACFEERIVDDKIILSVCQGCQMEMMEEKDEKRKD